MHRSKRFAAESVPTPEVVEEGRAVASTGDIVLYDFCLARMEGHLLSRVCKDTTIHE